jgi:hypothetical protein
MVEPALLIETSKSSKKTRVFPGLFLWGNCGGRKPFYRRVREVRGDFYRFPRVLCGLGGAKLDFEKTLGYYLWRSQESLTK